MTRPSPNPRPSPHRAAFTLVETMMALFAFAIILLGALGVASFSNNTAQANAYKAIANQAAQGFIEQIRGLEYQKLLTAAETNGALPLKYYDPVKVATEDFTKNPIPVYDAAGKAEIPSIDKLRQSYGEGNIDGVYVNTAMDADGTTTAASKMRYWLRIVARKDPRFDGMAFDLLYSYDVPSPGGGTRTVTDVQTAYVANTAN